MMYVNGIRSVYVSRIKSIDSLCNELRSVIDKDKGVSVMKYVIVTK